MKDLHRDYKPDVIALFETKIQFESMGNFFNQLGLTENIHIDPQGKVGGIWLLWNPRNISLKAFHVSQQCIHAIVTRNNYEEWLLSAVYASPIHSLRDELWTNLTMVANQFRIPWLAAGDFNDHASSSEKKSLRGGTDQRRVEKFVDHMNKCRLLDLGCSGPAMTWSNGRLGMANTMVRLDRALANPEWRLEFPEATVTNLQRTYSDHSPILVYTEGKPTSNLPSTCMPRPFRFLASWLEHPLCHTVIEKCWLNGNSLGKNLLNYTTDIKIWNKEVFGNIFARKKYLKARIKGIQTSQENIFSHNLDLLECNLKNELNLVLKQEEILWLQKSRVQWLTEGDRNTKFFHVSTIIRRNRNKIDKVKIDGEWCANPVTIASHINMYFNCLFARSHLNDDFDFDPPMSPKLSDRDNNLITGPLSWYEVKKAVFSMQPLKAPGPDGYQPKFFQFYWEKVCISIFEFVKNCFTNWTFPADQNKCFITLIPKIDNPESITNFRPITLCNVIYKVVTKVLVNRLRPLLDKIVGPCQTSFLPGRQASDNFIISQEIIHDLQKRKGKIGGMVFKIDLEKAYDKVSWEFLEKILLNFNFDRKWISLIMSCVTKGETAILWNGHPLEPLNTTRGLRQGDPLSPYLFVLCLEYLSNLINEAVSRNDWKGIKTSRNGPTISHLFFADVLMLFAQADLDNANIIMDTLDEFCGVSGQTINFQKSNFFISPNVPRREALAISFKCGMQLSTNLGIYLGFPLIHGKVSKNSFNHVVEKVQNKLAGWKTKLLSLAGRATLIQAVTSTIPNHNMQSLCFPQSMCEKVDKLNRDFLWGDTEVKKKVHLVKWDEVCKPKALGGLGLRKCRYNNQALISKLGWRMLNEDKPLWVKVLKCKYKVPQNPRNWVLKNSPSPVWKSIFKAKTLLVKGTKWNVGDGRTIDIFKDVWVGNSDLSSRLELQNANLPSIYVNSLITNSGVWDVGKLRSWFPREVADDIENIPLPSSPNRVDKPGWCESGAGKFSVGSCYSLILNLNDVKKTKDKEWQWLWKLKLPNKIIFFLWLLRQDKILSNVACAKRGITHDVQCKKCGYFEDGEVDFFSWLDFNLNRKCNNSEGHSWIITFASTLWHLWKSRNDLQFEGIDVLESQVAFKSINFAKNIVDAFKKDVSTAANHENLLIHWSFPPSGLIKINTDGSCFGNPSRGSYGGLARSDQGKWIEGFCGILGASTPIQAELWGLRQGFRLAKEKNWTRILIESDCQDAVKLINGEDEVNNHPWRNIIEECRTIKRELELVVIHVLREANKCADKMAKLGSTQNEKLVKILVPPMELVDDLIADLQGIAYPRGF